MNIVFLDSTAIPKHIPIPLPSFPHNWVEYEYTSAEQTIERAKDADIIITSKVILSREVLQQLPKLKLIAITATGTNNVDLEAAKEFGVAGKKKTGYLAKKAPANVLGKVFGLKNSLAGLQTVFYSHLPAHERGSYLPCRFFLSKKKKRTTKCSK